MFISLDQAIEIHAKVLLFRAGDLAEKRAIDTALLCKKRGDHWGYDVWMKVASTVETLKKTRPTPRALNS